MRLPKFRCKNKVGNWCFFTVLHSGNVNEENFALETLSEFTGLLDRQGVEIYEGDIIKVKKPFEVINKSNTFVPSKFDEYVGVVVYRVAGFVIDLAYEINRESNYDLSVTNFGSYDFKDEIEVIGNIYENSELIENSK